MKKANNNYTKILNSLKEDYKKFNFSKDIKIKESVSFKENFKNNFFALMMLSFLEKAGLSEEKIVKYGKIILCLRNIVTSTDNMIDTEDKGIIHIDSLKEITTRNVFNILIHQNIIDFELKDEKMSKFLLEKLYKIANSEAKRDVTLYKTYPSEEFIIKEIHEGIGGELLAIAFEVPIKIEKNQILEKYKEALFKIGMSLQALDDLVDIEEDKQNGKVNVVTAYNNRYILESEKNLFDNYLLKIIEQALDGFLILENNSYPIDRKTGLYLMKKLFKIRNMDKQYFDIFEKI